MKRYIRASEKGLDKSEYNSLLRTVRDFYNEGANTEVSSKDGVWSIYETWGEPFAELTYNGEPACAIHLIGGDFTIEPFSGYENVAQSLVKIWQQVWGSASTVSLA